MIAAIVLELINNILRLFILILEGTPVDVRQAQARTWFWMTWPVAKPILKLAKTPEEVLTSIEILVGKGETKEWASSTSVTNSRVRSRRSR